MRPFLRHVVVALLVFVLTTLALGAGATTPSTPTNWTPCSAGCGTSSDCNVCCLGCLSINMQSYNNCIGCCALRNGPTPCAAPKPKDDPVLD